MVRAYDPSNYIQQAETLNAELARLVPEEPQQRAQISPESLQSIQRQFELLQDQLEHIEPSERRAFTHLLSSLSEKIQHASTDLKIAHALGEGTTSDEIRKLQKIEEKSLDSFIFLFKKFGSRKELFDPLVQFCDPENLSKSKYSELKNILSEFLRYSNSSVLKSFRLERIIALLDLVNNNMINKMDANNIYFSVDYFNGLKIMIEEELPEEIVKKSATFYGNFGRIDPLADWERFYACLKRAHSSAELVLFYTCPDIDLKQLEKSIPLENQEENWESYIARKNVIAKCPFYSSDQKTYGMLMCQSVLMGAKLYENGYDLEQLFNFLAYRRYTIAVDQKHDNADSFGALINSGASSKSLLNTPCEGIYEELGEELEKLHSIWSDPKRKEYTVEREEGEDFRESYISGEIEGMMIRLSRFSKDEELAIRHTPSEHLPVIFSHLHKLHQRTKEEKDPKALLKTVGEMFWWICQAKPWQRGDPSIAEMLVKALWIANGNAPLPPWKVGIVPWEEVMKTLNAEEFAEKFPSLFDGKIG